MPKKPLSELTYDSLRRRLKKENPNPVVYQQKLNEELARRAKKGEKTKKKARKVGKGLKVAVTVTKRHLSEAKREQKKEERKEERARKKKNTAVSDQRELEDKITGQIAVFTEVERKQTEKYHRTLERSKELRLESDQLILDAQEQGAKASDLKALREQQEQKVEDLKRAYNRQRQRARRARIRVKGLKKSLRGVRRARKFARKIETG